MIKRIFLYLLAIAFLDIFLCRLHYRKMVSEQLTSRKKTIIEEFESNNCEINDQTFECKFICETV